VSLKETRGRQEVDPLDLSVLSVPRDRQVQLDLLDPLDLLAKTEQMEM
jgi:hypothetical protein